MLLPATGPWSYGLVIGKSNVFLVFMRTAFLIGVTAANPAIAQAPTAAPPARPAAPTRDSATPGYVTAKELPDGANASPTADGNFILGPTHPAAREGRPRRKALALRERSSTSLMESGRQQVLPGHRHGHSQRPGRGRSRQPRQESDRQPPRGPTLAKCLCMSRNNSVAGATAPFIVGAWTDLTRRCSRHSWTI